MERGIQAKQQCLQRLWAGKDPDISENLKSLWLHKTKNEEIECYKWNMRGRPGPGLIGHCTI